MKNKDGERWTLLVIHITGRRGTTRMRVWRALRAAGAAVLRDGVYLLPGQNSASRVLDEQANVIRAAGGLAHVLPLADVKPEQNAHFRKLFDRGSDYAAWIRRAQRKSLDIGRRGAPAHSATVRSLRREYEAIQSVDFFPGPAAAQAAGWLAEIEAARGAAGSGDEPSGRTGRIRQLDARHYRARRWATRAKPWVDRMASAWLIRRFIDPKAKFVWLSSPPRPPKGAVGFDFDGADFTHVGARVTFEVLLASFGLEGDRALRRIAEAVHYLDVGGAPVAEAPGLAAVLGGARQRAKNDDALLAESNRVFENLYITYISEKGE